MKCAIATKIGMTQLFRENGAVVPCTLIQLRGCTVVGKRVDEKDQYSAVILAAGQGKNVPATVRGVTAKAKVKSPAVLVEFRCDSKDLEGFEIGQVVGVDDFAVGTDVVVIGTSKGKGFQGVVRRHNFGGQQKTHGRKHDERKPGSIGSTFPEHVIKGKRMAGRMGQDRVTIKGVEVVAVHADSQMLALKGSLPGANGTYVRLYTNS